VGDLRIWKAHGFCHSVKVTPGDEVPRVVEVRVMTTHAADDRTKTRPGGWIAALIAALVALVVGIGVGFLAFSPKPMNAEVDSLVRDYIAAWDAGDGQAVLDLMTDDGTHTSFQYRSGYSGDQLSRIVASHEGSRFEVIGEVIVAGDSAPYEASHVARITDQDEAGSTGAVFVNNYVIVEVDGQLKIQSHTTGELAGTGDGA
jgi:uncharacterized protein (TIGR02246 family)